MEAVPSPTALTRPATLLLLSGFVAFNLSSCSREDRVPAQRPASAAPTVGYDGPIITEVGRELLVEIEGVTFRDADSKFGGGWWQVGKLVVLPNPAFEGDKGPAVKLSSGERSQWLPMTSDIAATELYQAVNNSEQR